MKKSLDVSIGFIGAGTMGEALIRGVVLSGLVTRGMVHVADKSHERRDQAVRVLGVSGATGNADLVRKSDVVMLAIKPQDMAHVLEEIAPASKTTQLFISIAAGISTRFIEGLLCRDARVVRVMPNTPALVGAGTAGIATGRCAGEDDLALTEKILGATCQCTRVEEPLMDAVTALSGSGPADVFYLVEAMVQAGVAEGLSPEAALELVRRTVLGAARLLIETQEDPAQLRRKVTSPGGTTEAAIAVMEEAGVRESLVTAVRRAAERSRELGS